MDTAPCGYDGRMSETDNEPQQGTTDAERDLAEHERPPHKTSEPQQPDVGLISDEDLPEDLQPTDDNPLAQNPGEESEDKDDSEPGKVEGMPDMGSPGAPA